MDFSPFDVQINIGFDEQQAQSSLDKILKTIQNNSKLNISLDINNLNEVSKKIKNVGKDLSNKKINLDSSKATEILKNI